MRIGIIGSNGFLGTILYTSLIKHFDEVVGINRQNYRDCLGTYDIIINANGNSRKYWANNNALSDFDASVTSVYKTMFDFSCSLYIYISTADVYNQPTLSSSVEDVSIETKQQSIYGFNKFLAESIIKKCQRNFIILRCSAIVGNGLKKGIIYDAMSGAGLFITKDSCVQFISANAIADIIKKLLEINIKNIVLNIGGSGTTSINYIENILNTKLLFSPHAFHQYYEMNVNKLKNLFSVKTSNYYVKEVLNERME